MADDPDGRTSAHANGGGGPKEPLAHGLGVFSFALGVPQVLAPGRVNRLIGVRDDARSRIVDARRRRARDRGRSRHLQPAPAGRMDLGARRRRHDGPRAAGLRAAREERPQPAARSPRRARSIGAFAADVFDGVRLSRSGNGDGEPPQDDDRRRSRCTSRPRSPCGATAPSSTRFWRDFEHFPQFMAHLEEVRATGANALALEGARPARHDRRVGRRDHRGRARRADRLALGRGLEGRQLRHRALRRRRPATRAPRCTSSCATTPPGGAVGATVAEAVRRGAADQVKDDLRRFKQVMETGEVVRSDGSPEGPLGRRQLKQRPAHPLPDDELAAHDDRRRTS